MGIVKLAERLIILLDLERVLVDQASMTLVEEGAEVVA